MNNFFLILIWDFLQLGEKKGKCKQFATKKIFLKLNALSNFHWYIFFFCSSNRTKIIQFAKELGFFPIIKNSLISQCIIQYNCIIKRQIRAFVFLAAHCSNLFKKFKMFKCRKQILCSLVFLCHLIGLSLIKKFPWGFYVPERYTKALQLKWWIFGKTYGK